MEPVMIILLIIVIVLLLILIFRRSGNVIEAMEQQLAQSKDDLLEQERQLQPTLSEGMHQNIRAMGDGLLTAEKLGREAQEQQLKLMDRGLNTRQQALREELNAQLSQLEKRLQTFELSSEQKLEGMRSSLSRHMTDMQESNSRQLDQIRATVDEKLQKTLDEKMTQSFQLVSSRLEEVYKGLGEMQTLAAGVGDLKKVLSNVKTRGILGEYQLGALLAELLAPEQYETDIATIPGSKNRVEFAVRLPGEGAEPVYLPIDSKFHGEAYTQLQEAYETGDPATVKAARDVLVSRLKQSAKDIRDKYVEPPYTTSFGILFVPFEGLYAEAVNLGMVEILQQQYQINLAGPSTMAALLNALQMGFHTLAIQKRSSEVWQVLGAVKTEFLRFEEILAATQKHMQQVSTDLDKLVGVRTRAINRKLRSVEQLEPGEAAALLEDSAES